MPNHITNVIAIHGVQRERIAEIFRAIHMDEIKHRNSIDFNKLIPMPPELKVESSTRSEKALKLYQSFAAEAGANVLADVLGTIPESEVDERIKKIIEKYEKLSGNDPDLLSFGEQLYNNIQKHGAADWYDWSITNWGSKWNSYGYEGRAFHNADNEIEFQTAWSSVKPIMQRLSEIFPDAQFYYKWADEDIGANVGEQIWQNGKVTEENIPTNRSAEAYEMAAAIIPVDLEEMGYVYSEEDNTYHYVEELDIENQPDEDESENQGMRGIE